ncbi:hypothetical protein [Streptomyces capitiformicae]|uniref:Uncharacterized protein n=1 Tax=Streptomyces capitiformicae TaxID=2014920 RepID=A0A919GSD2_9ACTN|nr:hypothetical protein [Streptomyces capitiformicae]GHH89264.1 hypothetical protein GCM10017771_39060 [Streptomyces capitiformicae]
MGDRAKESSAHKGKPGTRGTRITAAAPLALYCSVMGVLAVGAGALAALLVPSGEARVLVWLVVTVLIAGGAGLWWGIAPVTERLRVLGRVLEPAQPRRSQHH